MMLCKPLNKEDLPLWVAGQKDGQWAAEVKEDGDRVRMTIDGDGKVSLTNRRGKPVTQQYPEFSKPIPSLKDCVLDGEMCVLNEDGVSMFNEGISFRTHCKYADTIREAMDKYPVTFVVFDILVAGGENVRNRPLKVRREILEIVLSVVPHGNIQLIEQTTDILEAWKEATKRGEEGIVIKDRYATYQEGKRSGSWLKVKDIKEVDLEFHKYEEHNKGITIESNDGIRVTVNGAKSYAVKKTIDQEGKARVAIRHLGQTESGKYRQPVFHHLVVEG